MSVCLSVCIIVCLLAYLGNNVAQLTSRNFYLMLIVAVAQSFSGDISIMLLQFCG